MKCAICGKEIANYGNNPWPVRTDEKARCCDDCNGKYVIPARIMIMNCNRDEINDISDALNKFNPGILDSLLTK